jgi:hypothetical protein
MTNLCDLDRAGPPASLAEGGGADLWRTFLAADERDSELHFAAEDGSATQAEANAAHAEQLRLLRAIIEAPSSPGAMLNRARLMLWFEGAYDLGGAQILTDLDYYDDDKSELVRRLYRDLESLAGEGGR